MPYQYLEHIAMADVAFEARGSTLPELYQEAAAALTNTMVRDLETIAQTVIRRFCMAAPDVEMLLYHFLQELIFIKDADRLLFRRYELDIKRHFDEWRLQAQAFGEEIDSGKHELLADVKAVSFHNFKVLHAMGGWTAEVIIDV